MIVLKPGQTLRTNITGNISGVSTVTYWSVDTSNVWTPNSFSKNFLGLSTPEDIILLAPTGNEVAKVVENMWIMIATNGAATPTDNVLVSHFDNVLQTVLAGFPGAAAGGKVITMSRDGLFSIATAI